MNFFKYFEIPETIFIDQKILKRKYYILQKKYHPDFFLKKKKNLKKEYLKKSKKINQIYKILKNTLKRTKYFLYIKGYEIYNKNFLKKKKKKFLITQFLINEEINYIKHKKLLFLKKLNFLYFKYIKKMFNIILLNKFKKTSFILYKLFFFKKILSQYNYYF